MYCVTLWFLCSSPCQTWWWPYRKRAETCCLSFDSLNLNKVCYILTYPPYIIVILWSHTTGMNNLTIENLILLVAHAWGVSGMNFQENHSNGSSDTWKCTCSPSKVPSTTDQSQTKSHCSACVEIARCSVAGISLQWRQTATLFTNKVPLNTNPSPQNFLCSAAVGSVRGVSVKSCNGSQNTSQKVFCSPIKVSATSYFLSICFSITVPSMLSSSKWFPYFRFTNKTFYAHILPHTCQMHMHPPIYHFSFSALNNIQWAVQIMKTPSMHSPTF